MTCVISRKRTEGEELNKVLKEKDEQIAQLMEEGVNILLILVIIVIYSLSLPPLSFPFLSAFLFFLPQVKSSLNKSYKAMESSRNFVRERDRMISYWQHRGTYAQHPTPIRNGACRLCREGLQALFAVYSNNTICKFHRESSPQPVLDPVLH